MNPHSDYRQNSSLHKFVQSQQTSLVLLIFLILFFFGGSLHAQEVEINIGSTPAFTIQKNVEGDVIYHTPFNENNLFMGYQSGLNNGKDSVSANNGGFNTAFGSNALRENTSGQSNTAVGYATLYDNISGNQNTALGWAAMQANDSGDQNTGLGFGALRGNTSGGSNAAVGLNALNGNTTGFNNVGMGYRSGIFNQGGNNNVFLGGNAGAGGNINSDAHNKSNNVMIGYNSGEQAQGDGNVFLGYESGKDETGNNKLYIENSDADANNALIYGEFDNDLIRLNGKVTMRDGYSDEDGDTKVEVEQSADDDKIRFTSAGDELLRFEKNSEDYFRVQTNFNEWNTIYGYNSAPNIGVGADGTTLGVNEGKFNTAFGNSSLNALNIGIGNVAVGALALNDATSASSNVAIGSSALSNLVSGSNNVAVGEQALLVNTGSGMTGIGRGALNSSVAGSNSVAVGYRTGVFDTQSLRSVYIGYSAGAGGTTFADAHAKQNNVMIGYNSGQQAQGDGNVFLGYESGKDEMGNNKLYIENSDADSNNALIYGEFDNNLLRVNGSLNVNGAYTLPTSDSVNGYVLTTDGSGNVTWESDNAGVWSLGTGDDCLYEDGDVGIGLGNAIYRLDVKDNSTTYVARFENTNSGNSDGIIVQAGADTNPTSSSYYMLFLDGNGTNIGSVRGNGSGGITYNTTSDRRLKMNIEDYTSGLELIEKIEPRLYERKSLPGKKEIGFIAQELYEVFPQAVAGTPDSSIEDPMMVDYSTITPVLVAAIQELKAKNQKLEEELKELTIENLNETSELKASLETVMKRLDAIEQAN